MPTEKQLRSSQRMARERGRVAAAEDWYKIPAGDPDGWTHDTFMRKVGQEGIKNQQAKMRSDADEVAAGYDLKAKDKAWHQAHTQAKPSTFKKGGMVRRTGLAKVHRGERVLTAKQQKKRVAAKH